MTDSAPGKFHVGDTFPVDLINDADCTSAVTKMGFPAACILNAGHNGQHVAVGFEGIVVEVWS